MNTTIKKNKEQDSWRAEINVGRKDMQGLIARGYNSLNAACYIFVEITDAVLAKQFFNTIISKHITSADKSIYVNVTPKGDPQNAAHMAFTNEGLKKLGLDTDTFSREFLEGMATPHRSALLGDTESNEPKNWCWGNNKNVHCVLLLYAENNKALAALETNIFNMLDTGTGLNLVKRIDTFEYNDKDEDKEHFGFRDGLSQPVMKGFSQSANTDEKLLINPGEFILGYKNEYDNYSPGPYVDDDQKSVDLPYMPDVKGKKDLGKNGTYLVFRQIEQNVEEFWKFAYHNSREIAVSKTEKAIKLAAKMVGRWPEGQPLAICPDGSYMDEDSQKDFSYYQPDKDGIRCPFGAHIRRTNPRDQVHTGRNQKDSLEMSQRHRMLRRGRIYGKPLKEKMNIENMIWDIKEKKYEEPKNKRGLNFICLVSDIGRQFEFVQNVWANTSTFADLCNEVDPLISPRPTNLQPKCHEFTTPQQIIRNRYTEVPMFTTVVGGAYFFMPGLNALKYIMK